MIRTPAALAMLAVLTGLSCGDRGTISAPGGADTPGSVVVALVTPHPDDGAMVIALRGPGVAAVEAASPDWLVYTRDDGAGVNVIVVGELAAGPLLSVHIGAVNRLAAYTATVEQVAGRSDSLRTDLTGYGLRFVATP